MTNRDLKKIVFFVLLAGCAGTSALFYAVGSSTLATISVVIYAIEAWWIWRRHFGRPLT
jgi:hypothetical protein